VFLQLYIYYLLVDPILFLSDDFLMQEKHLRQEKPSSWG